MMSYGCTFCDPENINQNNFFPVKSVKKIYKKCLHENNLHAMLLYNLLHNFNFNVLRSCLICCVCSPGAAGFDMH